MDDFQSYLDDCARESERLESFKLGIRQNMERCVIPDDEVLRVKGLLDENEWGSLYLANDIVISYFELPPDKQFIEFIKTHGK